MINTDELDKEILMLEKKDTTYANCERLAWLYIVRDHITGQHVAQPTPLDISGESELLQAVSGRDSVKVWAIIDDLMDTLHTVNPRVYSHVMEKILSIDKVT